MQALRNFSTIGIMGELLGTESANDMVCLTDLKSVLYELLLTSSDQPTDKVQLDQKLGVSITKAAQREGNVQIIQLQNANVHHITEKVVEALKIVDALEAAVIHSVEYPSKDLKLLTDDPIEIEPPPDCVLLTREEAQEPQNYTDAQRDANIHREFMELMYRNNLNWKQMQQFVMSGYLDHVMEALKGNRGKMAEFLDLQRTYISKKIGEFKKLEDENDDNGSGTGKRTRNRDSVSETDSESNK